MYSTMSNVDINFNSIDYSVGELTMAALNNDRSVVSATWDDFLKLPRVAGYENNVKRVPNNFAEGVRDKINDPLNTMDGTDPVKSLAKE